MNEQTDLSTQLTRVKEKLVELKKLDRAFSIFGASVHRYRLNDHLSDSEIGSFEDAHKIELPTDYRNFTRFLGNGGAGPFSGLGTLENGIFGDMDSPNANYKLDLSKPFQYVSAWNIEAQAESGDDDIAADDYYDHSHANSLLRLCNFGCGVFINLVVKGPKYGHIWTDDRVNYQGLYPSIELKNEGKVSFIAWYELWLDESIGKFRQ